MDSLHDNVLLSDKVDVFDASSDVCVPGIGFEQCLPRVSIPRADSELFTTTCSYLSREALDGSLLLV